MLIIGKWFLGVAQFGSVLEWGSRGRRFNSCHPDHVGTSDARSDFYSEKINRPITVPPLPQKSHSVHLLGCKRSRDDSLSLPTFCRFDSVLKFFTDISFATSLH